MGDVRELLEKVEAGEIGDGLNTSSVFAAPDDMNAVDAFDGSLDAALALHKAVLPGWTLDQFGERAGGWIATLGRRDGKTPRPAPTAMVRDNPARAWLIAILRALSEDRR